jgi:hypothetical protein
LLHVGGNSLAAKYKGSPFLLLSTVFPEYQWLPWKFSKCPSNFWDNIDNQKTFLRWAEQQLNITDLSGWYNATRKVITERFQVENYRISLVLTALHSLKISTTALHQHYFQLVTPRMIGYHGNLMLAHTTILMT